MRKQFLSILILSLFAPCDAHVLDEVIRQCHTKSRDLNFGQRAYEHLGSVLVGAITTLAVGMVHRIVCISARDHDPVRWLPIHAAIGAAVGYGLRDNLRISVGPEHTAANILAQHPMHGQMLEYLELESGSGEFGQRMSEIFPTQQAAYAGILKLKAELLNIINEMNGISKYNGLEYRLLLQQLQGAIHKLQKGERAIVKTESWFLETIYAYTHIYNLIHRYDNQELINALLDSYNGSKYPRLTLIDDIHRFQYVLQRLNQNEYASQDCHEQRSRNLIIIGALQKIIITVENSYEYQAERKIKNQADQINALEIKSVVQDVHTIGLHMENQRLREKLRNEELEKAKHSKIIYHINV